MIFVNILVISSAVIFNSIELVSLFDCYPNGEKIPWSGLSYFPGRPHPSEGSASPARYDPPGKTIAPARSDFPGESFAAARFNSPGKSLAPVRYDYPENPLAPAKSNPSGKSLAPVRSNSSTSSQSPEEPPLDDGSRSRSTSSSHPANPLETRVLGLKLDQLKFIRIVPLKNPQRQFELRKYVFPTDKSLRRKSGTKAYEPIVKKEHIVLSTSDGQVLATLEGDGFFMGIYNNYRMRLKIDMLDGKVIVMNQQECKDIPVGSYRPFLKNYKVIHVNKV